MEQVQSLPLRGRQQRAATTPTWKLFTRLALRGRVGYLARFPSNYALMIARRKYDAFTTDRAYDERPSSWLGPLGWWADRRVLAYPLHVALRERLALVTGALVEEAAARLDAEPLRTVRVLSAPSGLCRDLIQADAALALLRPETARRVAWHAADIDATGTVIPEAKRRASEAGTPISFVRGDLFAPATAARLSAVGAPYDVISCVGLSAWLDLPEVEDLLAMLAGLLAPGGLLLLDNFAAHAHSAMGPDLEIDTRYHDRDELIAAIERAGFRLEAEQVTANGVNTLFRARRD